MLHARMRTALTLLVTMLAVLAVSAPVAAKKGKKGLAGQIIVSEQRFPSRFKSDAKMKAHMKKVNKTQLVADKSGVWSFEYMVFSTKPINSLQASTNIYLADAKCNKVRFVNAITVVPFDKSDSIISGHATLSASENFEPDKRYLLEFSRTYRGQALASTCVALLSNPDAPKESVSNEVNF